jgi:hypothetical protein
MNTSMGDQERVNDFILSQKQIESSYNIYAGECSDIKLRDTFLNILSEEHKIQSELFSAAPEPGLVSGGAGRPKQSDPGLSEIQQHAAAVKAKKARQDGSVLLAFSRIFNISFTPSCLCSKNQLLH